MTPGGGGGATVNGVRVMRLLHPEPIELRDEVLPWELDADRAHHVVEEASPAAPRAASEPSPDPAPAQVLPDAGEAMTERFADLRAAAASRLPERRPSGLAVRWAGVAAVTLVALGSSLVRGPQERPARADAKPMARATSTTQPRVIGAAKPPAADPARTAAKRAAARERRRVQRKRRARAAAQRRAHRRRVRRAAQRRAAQRSAVIAAATPAAPAPPPPPAPPSAPAQSAPASPPPARASEPRRRPDPGPEFGLD